MKLPADLRLSPEREPYVLLSPFVILFLVFGVFPLAFSRPHSGGEKPCSCRSATARMPAASRQPPAARPTGAAVIQSDP